MARFILSAFADEAQADLKGQIAALKRNNIGFIELRNIDGKCVIDYTDEEIEGFAEELHESGINVSSLGSPIGKYNITDDFAPHFEKFKKACKTCKILGTDKMRMFSFFIPDGKDAMDYKDEVLSRLNTMLDYAEKEGIFLCHENEARCHIKDGTLHEHSIVPAGYGDGKIKEVLEIVDSARGDRETFLTVEPHLFKFIGYSNLDNRTLKHKFSYANSNESFDAAVSALKDILKNLGFIEGDDRKWRK